MKTALTLLPALLLAPAIAFAGGPRSHVREAVDPYTHLHSVQLDLPTSHCKVQTTDEEQRANVVLTLEAYEEADGVTVYNVTLDIANDHLIHMGSHGTLETSVDGVTSQFRPIAPKTRSSDRNAFTGARRVHEGVHFGVDRNFVSSLAEAHNLQFRWNAEDDSLERCTPASQLKDIPDFLAKSGAFGH